MKGPVGRQPQPAGTLVLDIEARREAWVQGCVQFCDDVAFSGDLDWEFALFRALGVRPAETEGWYGHQAQKEDGRLAGVASRCRGNRCGRQ